ncbi:HlyD family secretion protein [Mesonia sp. HuA40]|uniref:HlyD family secretion protein n=1 Tax=Mesonia sp. HuA40 TaxID=2602761 RepID=UPI0011CB8A20|nr:HlyD family efflux transporter periplasmic adaptor subunit [Mesonia sp. HuA40]TXK71047.1 HlyD family efflux transporter periplasmic adaptor subunit [Mesonia sp. HuA40]
MRNFNDDAFDAKKELASFSAYQLLFKNKHSGYLTKILLFSFLLLFVFMFLPWTQTISGSGYVTTLEPNQRPQTIQSIIPGSIEKWYVREGDFVEVGDTILKINEIKEAYFDTLLLKRTSEQIDAKSGAVIAYQDKITALNNQLRALQQERRLKTEQNENKIKQIQLKYKSDSIALEAAKIDLAIAKKQYERNEELEKEGLKSLQDVEEKLSKFQKNQAYVIELENKLLTYSNELLNAQIEANRIQAEFDDKISKVQSNISSTSSTQFEAKAQVSKLENTLSNYQVRQNLYYVTSPIAGFINKTIKTGRGEALKAGEKIVNIMPHNPNLAVETYIEPLDLPLVRLGSEVRIQFDGWPTIIFSGWPNASYGTFGATVVAIDNNISPNGKYRLLLAPKEDESWPDALRVGSGARTLALLKNVPVWYEIWRNLNGFPPDYYVSDNKSVKK